MSFRAAGAVRSSLVELVTPVYYAPNLILTIQSYISEPRDGRILSFIPTSSIRFIHRILNRNNKI